MGNEGRWLTLDEFTLVSGRLIIFRLAFPLLLFLAKHGNDIFLGGCDGALELA